MATRASIASSRSTVALPLEFAVMLPRSPTCRFLLSLLPCGAIAGLKCPPEDMPSLRPHAIFMDVKTMFAGAQSADFSMDMKPPADLVKTTLP